MKWALRLYVAATLICMILYALERPLMNWDMVAYAGSAKAWETDDRELIHQHAYEGLEAFVGPVVYKELTVGSNYRRTYFEDPESFWQALSWYRIRPLYTGLIHGLERLGVNVYLASNLIAASSTVLGVLVLILLFRHRIAPLFWISLPFVLIANGTLRTARYSSPDGLAYLYASVLLWLFVTRHRLLLYALPLAVAFRTDLIFLVALIIVWLGWAEPALRKQLVVSFLATLLLYLGMNAWFGNHGWSAVFYLVFVSNYDLNYPATTDVSISVGQYLQAVTSRIVVLISNDAFATYGVIVTLLGAIIVHTLGVREVIRRCGSDRLYAVPLLGLAFITVHFLVFPSGLSRFYVVHYTACYFILLMVLSGRLRSPEQRSHAA